MGGPARLTLSANADPSRLRHISVRVLAVSRHPTRIAEFACEGASGRSKGISMNVNEVNRRIRSLRWADEFQKRAVEKRNYRGALKGAALIEALEHWINNNASHDIRTFRSLE